MKIVFRAIPGNPMKSKEQVPLYTESYSYNSYLAINIERYAFG